MTTHFLSLIEHEEAELRELLALAMELKLHPQEFRQDLAGKALGMIFSKNSTRTRISFEVGMYQLGGQAFYYGPNQLQLARGETIPDTARVLSRYLDIVMIREFAYDHVTEFAAHSSIPVINGLTDANHPCQAMADIMTIKERFGEDRVTVAFVGDGNNVAASLLRACVRFGYDFRMIGPARYHLPLAMVAPMQAEIAANDLKIEWTESLEEGLAGAQVVYTDAWTSMGQEADHKMRLRHFRPYSITPEVMALASEDAIFMHCLPAHRGEEVVDAVIDGPRSVVFDQAENRLHTEKAIMVRLLQE